jgi:hypothetical protein
MFLVLCGAGPCAWDTIEWRVTDLCEDGFLIEYKFYDFDNNLVWPSSSTHYEAVYYNNTYTHVLRCRPGARVCFGGRTGNLYWGVDVDGSENCSDCCSTCGTSGYYEFNAVCSAFEGSDTNDNVVTNEVFEAYDSKKNDLDANAIGTFDSGIDDTNARIVDDHD